MGFVKVWLNDRPVSQKDAPGGAFHTAMDEGRMNPVAEAAFAGTPANGL
jgi:hypothetical protein